MHLIIAINAYDHFSQLGTPHNDGEAVARLLHEKYNFRTEIDAGEEGRRNLLLLDNPSRYEILDTLQVLSESMNETISPNLLRRPRFSAKQVSTGFLDTPRWRT